MGKTDSGGSVDSSTHKRKAKTKEHYKKMSRVERGGLGGGRGGHGGGSWRRSGGGRGNWRGPRGGGSRGGYQNRDGGRGGGCRSWTYWLQENMTGFLCSCNFNEKDCIKEALNLLNEYAGDESGAGVSEVQAPVVAGSENVDVGTVSEVSSEEPIVARDDGVLDVDTEVSGGIAETPAKDTCKDANVDVDTVAGTAEAPAKDVTEVDDVDIDAELSAEIAELRSPKAKEKFLVVQTGVPNLVFIKSMVNSRDLAYNILQDIIAKKEQKSRFLLRLVPIELTCRAEMGQIEGVARTIFPKYFATNINSFQIVYKSRYNNNIDRIAVIDLLARLVSEINPLNVVDLTNPTYSIIVEVIKNVVCLSVVKDFARLKKFNLLEAAGIDTNAPAKKSEKKETEEKKAVHTEAAN